MLDSTLGKRKCENHVDQIKPIQFVKNNVLVLSKGKYFFFFFQYSGNKKLYAKKEDS